MNEEKIKWLLEGDVSIRYQAHRDLLNSVQINLQRRISQEGWGKQLMSLRNVNGYWGKGFYQPKWTSTHYTLLELRYLEISPDIKEIKQSLALLVKNEKGQDGGINPSGTIDKSDLCINRMFLNYASYFKIPEKELESVIDFIIANVMPNGGFNCHSNRKGARHSSLYTTLSIAEGINEFVNNNIITERKNCLKPKKAVENLFLCTNFSNPIKQIR